MKITTWLSIFLCVGSYSFLAAILFAEFILFRRAKRKLNELILCLNSKIPAIRELRIREAGWISALFLMASCSVPATLVIAAADVFDFSPVLYLEIVLVLQIVGMVFIAVRHRNKRASVKDGIAFIGNHRVGPVKRLHLLSRAINERHLNFIHAPGGEELDKVFVETEDGYVELGSPSFGYSLRFSSKNQDLHDRNNSGRTNRER